VKDKKFIFYSLFILIFYFALSLILLPNSFSGKWYFSPVLFTVFGIEVRWYGFLIASSILIATLIAENQSKKEKVLENDFYNAVILGVISSIIGARAYYILFNLSYYSKHVSEIINPRNGGLAIHGGILAAILSTFLYTKFKKNSSLKFFQGTDLMCFVIPLAQAIGRWGNFMNHEAYGAPTDLPWKMYIAPADRMPGYESFSYFHPTFFYESAINIFIFVFLFYYIRNKRKNFGEITGLYLMLYSVSRGFIELLRTDSLMIFGLKTASLISIILFLFGLILFIKTKNSHPEVFKK